jgi:DNA-binding NarL/FixJ family response regulator
LNAYSYTLIVTGHYQESLKHVDALTRVADNCGIEFAINYAQINRAKALIGMRKFGPASRTLSALERRIQGQPGSFFLGNIPVERARLYSSLGDLNRAVDVLSPGPLEQLSKAGRGEYLGWQAVLHAAAGQGERAQTLAAEVQLTSRGLEAAALSSLAVALVAVSEGDAATAADCVRSVILSGIWDPIVISVRAAPALAGFIAKETEWRGWLQRLLAASYDTSLARRFGLQVPRVAKRATALSPRESEVHDLLAQGLTNEEIANLLYISLSTTKVHVKHIYEKLGVRSRLEAARALRDDI